jgi:Na+-driven multidrug efflux pump
MEFVVTTATSAPLLVQDSSAILVLTMTCVKLVKLRKFILNINLPSILNVFEDGVVVATVEDALTAQMQATPIIITTMLLLTSVVVGEDVVVGQEWLSNNNKLLDKLQQLPFAIWLALSVMSAFLMEA